MDASLYYYLSGAVPHLQTCIEQVPIENMTFGFGLIYGLLSPILVGLKGFGIISQYPEVIRQVGSNFLIPTQINKIGNNTTINAHVGLSYYFYSDGGIVFVFLGCLALGYLSMHLYKKVLERNTDKDRAIYLMIMCVIIMSFIRFQFALPMYAVAILYISTFIYKKERL
jgi:hypothetical protein